MLRRLALALCLPPIVGCASDDAPQGPPPTLESVLALPPLHGAPDAANGGRIVDSEGREVILRGVNVNALAEYWQMRADLAPTYALLYGDVDQIAEIGWNAVRLLVSWSRVEPEPGAYDEAYLGEVERAVNWFAKRGIYSIVDFHQDAWGPTLAARPDEICEPPNQPAFGWDGAPGWATLDGGEPRCTTGIRELSPAVRAAFVAFWNDAPGPDGVGIRARYSQTLEHVAARLAPLPGVAGFDVMNEPNAFGDAEATALSALYAEALQAIRRGEAQAATESRLVLFEPSALWSSIGSGAPPDFARDPSVVYAPHVYTGGFTGGPITRAAFETARSEAALFGGAPVLSGEWGTGPSRADDPADGYFIAHQDLQDEFRLSATLWTWRESCGDPHKAADYRAGTVPYVWGEFDVDCATNTIVGVRQNLVSQLMRGYVRAAPGELDSLRYAYATGELEATGSNAASGAALVVFYPRSRHGEPRVTSSGLVRLSVLDAPGGNAYIAARARGGSWAIGLDVP
jgi:endoglycosylceramidase